MEAPGVLKHTSFSGWVRPIALFLVGFLYGIPVAISLPPRLMPRLPLWLNAFGCRIVIALIAGLVVGSISYIVLCLIEELQASRDVSASPRRLLGANSTSTTLKSGDRT